MEMEPFTKEEIEEYKTTFSLFDKESNGCIDTKDLGIVLRALGKNPTEKYVKEMIGEVDQHRTGKICFIDFLKLMTAQRDDCTVEEELKEAFKVFDREDKGYIEAAELRHVLICLGETLTIEEADDMIKEVDADNDGRVSFSDFVRMMNTN